ncbi:phosphatidylserine decarboxylase [Polychaeton citri CBS 116435]|uniref:Phosphatidylserine decarboxylase proenzyme 1, mitochondrial n=1 Tax=Polychaeton citri CBS 116435 TaxID=1314669 RepID=A0A9P4Q3D9_9PEZI|nr:phosphatidylserine decarboxylase [Polychaeton citri CBS 116435]
MALHRNTHLPKLLSSATRRQLASQRRRARPFSTSSRSFKSESQHRKESFSSRLRTALNTTSTAWRPIPISLGILVVGGLHLYRQYNDEWEQARRQLKAQQRYDDNDGEDEDGSQPYQRARIRPSGPWSVQIMSTLPLKFLSRIWGRFNEVEIPYYLRVPGFKLYGWIFGVKFDEIEEQDLHNFRNLSEFFYRTIKPGVRPLDTRFANALLSPADGKVVQFGCIEHGEVEQVKGVTYSIDALLGDEPTKPHSSNVSGTSGAPKPSKDRVRRGDEDVLRADEEFARVNGISYTIPNLLSGGSSGGREPSVDATDQSTKSHASSEAAVRADLASSPTAPRPWWYPAAQQIPTALYYCVVYLAPGDYHRFHSPVSWVVESRRHFAGELYSVSPFLVKNLPGLFTLNERVVLLGRWKWGFFSYTPVGATNVGSIVVNFDRELRTNSLLTDTLADLAAERAAKRGQPYSGYAEATYGNASSLLNGHALRSGEEMGGFMLGSTIVMVFEAPKGRRPSFDEGWTGTGGEDMRKGGWKWNIERGKTVRVGELLGHVEEDGGS